MVQNSSFEDNSESDNSGICFVVCKSAATYCMAGTCFYNHSLFGKLKKAPAIDALMPIGLTIILCLSLI